MMSPKIDPQCDSWDLWTFLLTEKGVFADIIQLMLPRSETILDYLGRAPDPAGRILIEEEDVDPERRRDDERGQRQRLGECSRRPRTPGSPATGGGERDAQILPKGAACCWLNF